MLGSGTHGSFRASLLACPSTGERVGRALVPASSLPTKADSVAAFVCQAKVSTPIASAGASSVRTKARGDVACSEMNTDFKTVPEHGDRTGTLPSLCGSCLGQKRR